MRIEEVKISAADETRWRRIYAAAKRAQCNGRDPWPPFAAWLPYALQTAIEMAAAEFELGLGLTGLPADNGRSLPERVRHAFAARSQWRKKQP